MAWIRTHNTSSVSRLRGHGETAPPWKIAEKLDEERRISMRFGVQGSGDVIICRTEKVSSFFDGFVCFLRVGAFFVAEMLWLLFFLSVRFALSVDKRRIVFCREIKCSFHLGF